MGMRRVTAGECAVVADVLESSAKSLPIHVGRGSTIQRLIKEMRWLGSLPAEAILPEAAVPVDRDRALRAFPLFEQARRLAIALVHTADVEGVAERARHLKDPFDRLVKLDQKAQDAFFELEFAGRCRERGLAVAFREPDIVALPDSDLSFSMACKRPRTLGSVPDNVRDARHQIERHQRLGFVVLGLEAVWQHDRSSQRSIVWTTPDDDAFHSWADERIAEVKNVLKERVLSRLGRHVAGVLVCGLVTAWSDRPSAYLWRWIHGFVDNPAIEGAFDFADFLDRLIFEPKSLETGPTGDDGVVIVDAA